MGRERGWWLGAKVEGWGVGTGVLEGADAGVCGERVLAKSHAEGSR